MNAPKSLRETEMALSPTDDRVERQKKSPKIRGMRNVKSRFAPYLRRSGDVDNLIKNLIPVLQDNLQADGFAFQYGSNLHVGGQTPPLAFIRNLIEWTLNTKGAVDQYQTTALHREWAPALEHKETACGTLIQPILVHQDCQLIWFRGPTGAKWVGRPKKRYFEIRQTCAWPKTCA